MITIGRFRIEKDVLELFQDYCKEKGLVPSELFRNLIYDILEENDIEYVNRILCRTSVSDVRNASPTMRYKVFKRDNYKCVMCGRSPARGDDITLEADHIIPYSKGGLTIEDNLQTLCNECNAGKKDDMAIVATPDTSEDETSMAIVATNKKFPIFNDDGTIRTWVA